MDARSRKTDPLTSKLASLSMQDSVNHLQLCVLEGLCICPGTFSEIAVRINLPEATVWKRLSELKEKRLVRAIGTRTGPYGRQQTVYIFE